MATPTGDAKRATVHANGVDFTYLELGDGPLALCLHGFPDTPHSYRHLLPALAGAGFRAVAPWMRGYAPTSVPADGHYQTGALATDALALHDALGGDGDAVLIGHDWGATAVYPAANHAPERWAAVVAMSVPHPAAIGGFLFDYRQVRRSSYMFIFQHPLAEAIVQADDFGFIDGLWGDWSPGLDDEEARAATAEVKEALREPENLSAALGYYRATLGGVGLDPRYDEIQAAGARPVTIPALYLHGTDDGCFDAAYAEQSAGFLQHERSRVQLVQGAGHFLQLDQPDEVNRLVIDFLAT